jgi:RNA polymerase sigma-70 factor (ECF subfamily)
MNQKSDQDLVKEVQNGDVKAFSAIVERYEPKLQRYARKFLFGYEDSADLVQEVFIKAYINIKSFDLSRSFSPWIYRIAHNEFINEIKKRGREPMSIFDSDTILPHIVGKQTADEDLHKKETREIIEKCLEKINPKYREPLVLYYFEELGYKEIAEIMHIPVSTIGIRLKRGKLLLKEIFEKNL